MIAGGFVDRGVPEIVMPEFGFLGFTYALPDTMNGQDAIIL
jgi:hypothetical protein